MDRSERSRQFETIWWSVFKQNKDIPLQSDCEKVDTGHLSDSLFWVQLNPKDQSFRYKMLGPAVQEQLGFDAIEFDANTLADPEDRKAVLERQFACHDHPIGTAQTHIFLAEETEPSMFETTFLPCWGSSGERLFYSLMVPLVVPTEIQLQSKRFVGFYSIAEVHIDLGKGIPDFTHPYQMAKFAL